MFNPLLEEGFSKFDSLENIVTILASEHILKSMLEQFL